MSVSISIAVLVLLFTFVTWYLSAVPRLHLEAKKSGLPIYFSPFSPNNPVWILVHFTLGYTVLSRLIPPFVFKTVKWTIPGWEHRSKYGYGKGISWETNFMLVTPSNNIAYISNPELAHAVLLRRKDFGRNEVTSRMSSQGFFKASTISDT
jgi:hypothetical protein